MAYKFTFDISKLPKKLFIETYEFCELNPNIESLDDIAEKFVKKFDVDKLSGLTFDNAKILIQDIIDIQIKNIHLRNYFDKSHSRALFLPHCCRKFMDSRCKAEFKIETSSYECSNCSNDCMVNLATRIAKTEGYDVYILPGASCLSKIFDKKRYEGVVGIACTDEIKLANKCLFKLKIPAQAIPLLKNGCAETLFSVDALRKILSSTNVT
jgi:hypothetical protein